MPPKAPTAGQSQTPRPLPFASCQTLAGAFWDAEATRGHSGTLNAVAGLLGAGKATGAAVVKTEEGTPRPS
jgi:hypothetical protein